MSLEREQLEALEARVGSGALMATREDVAALGALEAWAGERGARAWARAAAAAEEALAARPQGEALERALGALSGAAHLGVLTVEAPSAAEVLGEATWRTLLVGQARTALRLEGNRTALLALWAVSRGGRAALVELRGRHREARTLLDFVTTGLGLGALAVYDPGLRAEALAALERPPAVGSTWRARVQAAHKLLGSVVEIACLDVGLAQDTTLQLGGLAVAAWREQLPATTFDPGALPTEQRCILGTYLNTRFMQEAPGLEVLIMTMPWVVSRAAPELFFPAEVAAALEAPWYAAEVASLALKRLGDEGRAVRRIGKDDPCPCGSGRRFRRCCQRR